MSFCLVLLAFAMSSSIALAVEEVGIDEKLSATIPLDLSFVDEEGKAVVLRDLMNKPTVLNLVYFKCPSICGPSMSGISTAMDRMKIVPGMDYQVLTVSFNDQDKPALAKAKKAAFLKTLRRPIDPAGWRFLTGEADAIQKITDAVGFRFKKVDKEFIHAAAIVVLSADGKIARYLYGTTYLPLDLTMAIYEASQGRSGPSFRTAMLYCFSYDPEGKKYVFRLLPVLGVLTLLVLMGFGLYLRFGGKKK